MEAATTLSERALRIGEKALGVVVTRISDFKAEPVLATPGEAVTVTGKLEEHWPPLICTWGGVAGEGIDIYINGSKVATVTSGEGGGFTYRFTPTELGTYRVQAKYPGTWWRNPCESQEVIVRVVTEEEKKKHEQEEFMKNLVFWGSILGIAAVIGGVALYIYQRERWMAELQLLAARRK